MKAYLQIPAVAANSPKGNCTLPCILIEEREARISFSDLKLG